MRSLTWRCEGSNVSSKLFEMSLLHAINEFNDEKDHLLHKDGAHNQSEIPELTLKYVEKLNQSATTLSTTTNTDQVKEDDNDLRRFSKINSLLQKQHLNGNIIKIQNRKSLLQHLLQLPTTEASPVKETKPPSKVVAVVEVLDGGNTSQSNVTEPVVKKSVPEGILKEEENETNYLAAQMAKEINDFLQNHLLANKTAGILTSDSLRSYEPRFTELLGKLNVTIATAASNFTADKKKDLLISERTLLQILDLCSSILKNLNSQLSGNSQHKVRPGKYSSEREVLVRIEPEWEERDRMNHIIHLFYQLEEILSNLKIILKKDKEGEKHNMAEHLLDQSLSVVSQLEQIPWLKGRNSLTDFEPETLRDLAGGLSNAELIPHETANASV
ncbi:uncharacterized protein LOC132382367 isoform X2 [Hypanus sabinus]|uniref:uncharacterized protein LOC132382367 isoform X2 n=1 Tax=Hypanus sabinus TaxID=79690 RepID=UPI0028C4DE93|nr:uncharacterized protein LOC132382367 isoform X2 [Hypanus sabinus]